jgi:predicted nucleic acid-binding protein
MRILVDTNVWLRSLEPSHVQHEQAASAVKSLLLDRHELVVVPQIVYEFWVVSTRPVESNGLGLSVSKADAEVDAILLVCPLFHDDAHVFGVWRQLVSRQPIIGKTAHDARLVAAMLRHGVTHLLTFNEQDFARYGEITVVTPAAAASAPPSTP